MTAVEYDANGAAPADGVTVANASKAVTGPEGTARVVFGREGTRRLCASRGNDIASASIAVCVNQALSRCPEQRPEFIVRTDLPESLVGTSAPDMVYARAGNGLDRRARRRCGRRELRYRH